MAGRILILALAVIFANAGHAESGAAVQMQNKRKAGAAGMPKQLPPGYVMGPKGIQKIPGAGEQENAAREAAQQEENAEVKDEVGLDQITEALRSSAKPWELIISRSDKAVIVEHFIADYAKQGVTIRKPAAHYVSFIDQMSKNNPEMLESPFERILEIVAVMEYDFDNGQNKDQLAQKILGQQVYEKNRERLINSQKAH